MHILMYSVTLKSKAYLLFFQCFMQLPLPRWFIRTKLVVLFKYNINKHKTKYKPSSIGVSEVIITHSPCPKGWQGSRPAYPPRRRSTWT